MLGKYLLAGLMLCLARKSCSRPFSIRFWRRDFFFTRGTLWTEHRHMRVGSRRERKQELFRRPRRSWASGGQRQVKGEKPVQKGLSAGVVHAERDTEMPGTNWLSQVELLPGYPGQNE